jgi:hypothetical protein
LSEYAQQILITCPGLLDGSTARQTDNHGEVG